VGPDRLAGGGNSWRRLWGEFEVELPDEQLLVWVQFRVAAENECATVCRREVNIEHLDSSGGSGRHHVIAARR
jgi:hypothetical protein